MNMFRKIRKIINTLKPNYVTPCNVVLCVAAGVAMAYSVSFLPVVGFIAVGVCMTVVVAVCIEKIHIAQAEENAEENAKVNAEENVEMYPLIC